VAGIQQISWGNIAIALTDAIFGEQKAHACENACVCSRFTDALFALRFGFFRPGSCSCNLRVWLTAEESHQPFQILRRSRQVELLAHEAHPAQP